ncbi:Phosphate-binding protein PstS precursor [Thalassoglobus polymorphus]|uniref:Phosphate-binding protein n=2 Tax=Thalassoglobus polymorphus TaxID=2527994 RepID=A0A517QMU7_9PLAN|nr:Phosphate-binding protein PstS precursor [Thalassoglobus polymorphus]
MKKHACVVGASIMMLAFVTAGCTVKDAADSSALSGDNSKPSISIDGSSTVYPIAQAVAEEYEKQSETTVVVGTSGTGPGFSKFIEGVSDITNASRPIKQQEIDACKEKGIEYLELTIAIDGLSVVVNPENTWCDCLSVEQLKKIWSPGSQVKLWSDVDPSWPQSEMKLFGPDTDSGTFDYFTEAICDEGKASRSDYSPSVNDNVLVQGVSGSKFALGYFGYAYYLKNKDKLKVLGIADKGDANNCIKPSDESIESGKYVPLSRPLFLYVNKASLKKPEVAEFLRYCLKEGQGLVGEVGYVRLSQELLSEERKELEDAIESMSGDAEVASAK